MYECIGAQTLEAIKFGRQHFSPAIHATYGVENFTEENGSVTDEELNVSFCFVSVLCFMLEVYARRLQLLEIVT